jgi:hypothetical protein
LCITKARQPRQNHQVVEARATPRLSEAWPAFAADRAVQQAAKAADATDHARQLTCGEWVLVFKCAAPLPPGCDGPHKIFDSMPFHNSIPAVSLPPPDVRPLSLHTPMPMNPRNMLCGVFAPATGLHAIKPYDQRLMRSAWAIRQT